MAIEQMEIILKYFTEFTDQQLNQFKALESLYTGWNSKINVISRKDIDHLYERHVLHSLGIAKVISFPDGSTVIDAGTGGGFPGFAAASARRSPRCAPDATRGVLF